MGVPRPIHYSGDDMTVKLYPYQIKDTETWINVRKVSPNTLNDFKKWFDEKHPQPEIPTQSINYGDEQHPDFREEKNESHPDYQAALQARKEKLNVATQDLMIEEGVVYALNDDDKKSVKEFKERWKARTGVDPVGTDLSIFIRYIAVGTSEDLKELIAAITRRTQPTEVAVEEQLKSI
jgi:hypothetical protein